MEIQLQGEKMPEVTHSEEIRRIKCAACKERSCEMSIDALINGDMFPEPEIKEKRTSLLASKLPDSFWIKALNFKRALTRRPKVSYGRKGRDWIIHYKEYSLIAPSVRWIESTVDKFSEKFETFYEIEEGDSCVETGSCIGDMTLPILYRAGENGKVVAVEPMEDNIKYLRMNLEKFPNTEIITKAISDSQGKKIFHLHDTPTGHSLEASSERQHGEISVECDTLDNMFKNRKIDFFKLEVQGHEAVVLQNTKTFFNNVKKLVIETHCRYNKVENTYKKVLSILKDKPFDIKFCIQDGIVHCRRK